MRRDHAKCVPLAIALAFATQGCREGAGNEIEENQANQILPLPKLPVAEPPMDRAGLLEAVARVASATALGRDATEEQRRLDGQRFEIRIRFGCPSGVRLQGGGAPPFNVRFDEDGRTLRLRAAPDLTLEDEAIADLAGEGFEAVEGFWIYRPWLLADGCPAVPSGDPEPAQASDGASTDAQPKVGQQLATVPRQRVGLAQFFTAADPRTRRRDQRAYEVTKVLEEDEQPSAEGYNLVLSGRLRRLPERRVINCRVVSPDVPAECVVSTEFDRVRIERPGSNSVLAEWGD